MGTRTAVSVLLFALPFLAPHAKAQSDLPEGKGKDAVVQVCTGCHGSEEFTPLRMTKKSWSGIVDTMIDKGASGTDEQFDAVIDYLAAHFGKPVNVNKATAQDLQTGLSLPAASANAVVAYRTKNGPFQNLSGLLKVPGLDKAAIESQKDNIVY